MRKARLIAPWHQPDLMAVLEAEGLSVEELAALKGKPAIYHCVSRVVDRRFALGDAEREQFVRYMWIPELLNAQTQDGSFPHEGSCDDLAGRGFGVRENPARRT